MILILLICVGIKQVRKKNQEMKMLAEKKRYEEEEKQRKLEQELEEDLQRQAQLKLEGKEEQEVSLVYGVSG